MKKGLLGILSLSLALAMGSCSEDFDVAAPYKNITVVYGMLNYGESVQYIRIQKAFLDQNRSSLELAKISDSNYYRNIEVHMKELNGNTVLRDDILNRVDLNTVGFQKEPGTFFNDVNFGYPYTRALNPANKYRLVIKNLETGDVDSAIAGPIDTSSSSNGFIINEFARTTQTLSFSSNKSSVNFVLNIGSVPANARYFEGYIVFHYVNIFNGSQKDTSFTWRFATTTSINGNPAKLEVPTSEFVTVFKSYMPPALSGQTRTIDSVDMYVWAADNNYYSYLLANQVQGGITADQIKPTFTTIQGKNTLGLFGARSRRIKYTIPIDNASIDTLKNTAATRDLNITGRSDH